MPSSYTSAQKANLAQFVAVTGADRSSATRALKGHNWNVEAAVNAYFSGSSNSAANSATKSALGKLFDKYRSSDDKDSVDIEGMQQYLEDLGIPLDDIGVLVLSELVQSPSMGEMTREGFVNGWLMQPNSTSIEGQRSLLSSRRATIANLEHRDLFKRVYKHTFIIARTGNARGLPGEDAITYWRLLFTPPGVAWTAPGSPWLDWWAEFVEHKHRRTVTKDMWDQTLPLLEKTLDDATLSWWSEDAAWPSVIDEFVDYVKTEKRGETGNTEGMESHYSAPKHVKHMRRREKPEPEAGFLLGLAD